MAACAQDLHKPCYDAARLLDNLPWLGELVDAMQELGWGVYSFDHEDAVGQCEVGLLGQGRKKGTWSYVWENPSGANQLWSYSFLPVEGTSYMLALTVEQTEVTARADDTVARCQSSVDVMAAGCAQLRRQGEHGAAKRADAPESLEEDGEEGGQQRRLQPPVPAEADDGRGHGRRPVSVGGRGAARYAPGRGGVVRDMVHKGGGFVGLL